MTTKALSPAESRAATKSALRVSAWGLAIYLGTRLLGVLLEHASLPATVAQAVLAEFGCGRLGVAWSDPAAPMPETSAIVKRAGIGALFGLVAGVVVVGFLFTAGAVRLERVTPVVSSLAIALVTCGLYAMRDELLLHGLVMRTLVTVESPVAKVIACGLTSAAATYGEIGAVDGAATAIIVQGLLGMVFGALWVRDRGAWPAWGAHTAWLFTTGMLLQGGIFEGRAEGTPWSGGLFGPLGGRAALIALLPLAIGAVVGTRPGRAPGETPA